MTGGAGAAGVTQARGLAAERTELAWVRTALAGAGLTLTTVHLSVGPTGRPAAVAAGVAVAAVALAAAGHRLAYLRRHRRPAAPPGLAVALLAASVAAANLLGLTLALT